MPTRARAFMVERRMEWCGWRIIPSGWFESGVCCISGCFSVLYNVSKTAQILSCNLRGYFIRFQKIKSTIFQKIQYFFCKNVT